MEAGAVPSGLSAGEDPALAELREAYSSGNLVVFAGPGISTAAGLPSWARLATLLADHPRMHLEKGRREELSLLLERRRLVDALTVAEQALGRPELALFVERMFNDEDLPVPPMAQALAALAPHLKAVLTTNIDHLIERAFSRRWPPLWRAPIDIVQRRGFILKLHGTLLDRSSWVFTRSDYDHATWGHGSIRETLSRFFHSFPLLFIGHELEDEDFEALLAQVRVLAENQPPRHFALVPSGSILGVRRQSLERAGIRLIEYANPDGQHTEVERILHTLASAGTPQPVQSSQAPDSRPAALNPPVQTSPFPGLEYFDEDRAPLFFGRETEVSEALQLLGETPRGHMRWLQVEGASGTGKSSFARAGLLPKIRLGWVGGAPQSWCVAILRPGRQPLLSLAQAVITALRPPGVSLEQLLQQLRSSKTALASFLRHHTPAGHGFLLLVDQFEELFTLAESRSSVAFDRNLATCLEDSGGPLYLVTTVRGDFVGHLRALPELARLLPQRTSRYPLAPMGTLGLQAALKKPAESVGLLWEAGLPERLLEDTAGIESGLPLLAHALRELWAARSGRTLTHAAYGAFGGTLGALTRSADQLVESLGPEGRKRACQLLLALVTLQGGKAMRRSLTRTEALQAAGGDTVTEQVLARLSGGRSPTQPETAPPPVRLIVVTQEEGQDRIDLIHEALITRWTAFGTWMETERQVLARRDDLEAAARSWHGAGAPWRDLPSGAQLAYLRTASPITELARRFLQDAEKRERSRRRTLAATFTVLVLSLLGVSSLAIYAFRQRSLAQQRLSDALSVANQVVSINWQLQPLKGTTAAREDLLKSTSQLLDSLKESAQDNQAVLLSRAATHRALGDLARSHYDLIRARRDYEAGLELAQRLAALTPDDRAAQYRLAYALTNLGLVAMRQGRLDEARASLEQAHRIRRGLAENPPSGVSQPLIFLSLTDLGEIAHIQGRLAEARSFFQQAQDFYRPEDWLEYVPAYTLANLGDAAQAQGSLEEARSHFQKAFEIAQSATQENPSDAGRQLLFSCYYNLGDVAKAQGHPEEARSFFQQALELNRALARTDSTNIDYQRGLAISFSKLGAVAKTQGRLNHARALFEQALASTQVLVKENPSDFFLQDDLFSYLMRLGEVAQDQGQVDEARSFFQQALELTQALAKTVPSSVPMQRNLSLALAGLAEVSMAQGQWDEARSFLQRAQELTDALVKGEPSDASAQRALAVQLGRLGEIAMAQGRLDEARSFFERALDGWRAQSKVDPSNADLRRDLAVCLNKLGHVAQAQGRLREARSFFQEDLEFTQALATAAPSSAQLQLDWVASELHLARLAKISLSSQELHMHRTKAEQLLRNLQQHEEVLLHPRYWALNNAVAALPR